MKYYLIAGEASGDLHASRLMRSLKQRDQEAEFRFFGGDLMAAEGGTLVKHYRELAYMGFIPVLLHLRTILRNMKMCKQDITEWQPDVLILVDYPGFNLSIAKYIHRWRGGARVRGYEDSSSAESNLVPPYSRTSVPPFETELSVSSKLEALRAEQPLYRGLSFDTIAAYGEHGAVVHYEPTPETDMPLKPEGLLLLDSGAQYLDGTTDITRTIALGPLTEEQKRVYTLVLKGHIQVELCKFPSGASGTQLDILARQAMWREGLNYLHGTGHGVGSYLCVHEGPHQLRMEWKPAPLMAGMTVTDEPGIYLAGRFGVRIENTLLVVPYKETDFGEFLQFEPLTLCPIDKRPILVDMLTVEEIQWLNDYHQLVYDRLSLHLDEDERQWLADATKEISHL